jgi:hypothetical protein
VKGPNDTWFIEISFGIVVLTQDEDAWMMSLHSRDQIVPLFEIVVVLGEKDTMLENGMGEMHGIMLAGHAALDRQAHLTPCLPEQPGQQRGSAVVIEVEPHNFFSRAISWAVKSLGLPS